MMPEYRALEFSSADEAIQHTYASGRGEAILFGGTHYVMERAEAERLAATGANFTYLFEHNLPGGRRVVVTVPANAPRDARAAADPLDRGSQGQVRGFGRQIGSEQLRQRARYFAQEITAHARDLSERLAEVAQRLGSIEKPRDAWRAVAGLRIDSWDQMQRAMTRLELLSELTD